MLTLQKVNDKNLWRLMALQVKKEQEDFVATNTESVLEAYVTVTAGGVALPFGVYDGETPVGFLMIGYGTNDPDDPSVAKDNYCLWRLMIDADKQGRGYGRAALLLALDYIASKPCGEAVSCWLSYEPTNESARRLYRSVGFTETGERCGDEVVAVRHL